MSEELIPLLVFIAVALILAVIGARRAASQQHKRNDVLERIAERFSGRLEVRDQFSYPTMRLRLDDTPAKLKFIQLGEDNTHTQLTIAWPDPQLRCEVYPQNSFSGFRKLLGVEDIEIGSTQFDANYFIEGNNKPAIRELLNAEVQTIVHRLAALPRGKSWVDDVQLKWGGGALTITKPCHLATYASLEQFISLSSELLAAARNSRTSGIEFVGEIKELETNPSQCQVCGETLSSNLVYCASCRTPHHRDCWDYFGGCSTYACGQKKYMAGK